MKRQTYAERIKDTYRGRIAPLEGEKGENRTAGNASRRWADAASTVVALRFWMVVRLLVHVLLILNLKWIVKRN